jgi:hypothetical protein
VVVVVYRMADQAERTLRSLGIGYQLDVAERDYEILVVENRSDRLLGEERARACGANVRYISCARKACAPRSTRSISAPSRRAARMSRSWSMARAC